MPRSEWLALIMGHEATHLWQSLRGDEMSDSKFDDPTAYSTDLKELEAFKGGITQASRVARRPIKLRQNGADIEPDPLWFMPVTQRDYNLRISRVWTVRGTLLRLRDGIVGTDFGNLKQENP